ncbi:MAG TPA: hypothetical protein VGR20_24535 [Acidimicrobiia bacterium]|jgi:hypothetical protein|nr:hypothetical protein [Acidimicrobiia bacterium]
MRRLAGVLGVTALLAGIVAGPLSLSAQGADGYRGTFGAVASADAVRVTWIVPHAPASDTVLDLGGPSAQATLDSIGGSQAFASFPYPGENAVTAPSLIAGASGGQINLPSYPFWVGSTYPVAPKAESGSGPYAIKAQSTDTTSESSASVGLDSNGSGSVGLAKSHASTVSAPDAVTAEAATEVTTFAVGPLRIGQVLSTAKAVFGPGGTVTRTADTRITGAMVGDTPVAFTEKGLVVGSSPIPADPKPITDVLAQAKIGVEFMPRQDTDNGVVAPTLRVTQRDDAGQSITYVLGRTIASAQGAGVEEPSTNDDSTNADSTNAAANSSDQTDASGPAAGASFVAPSVTAGGEAGDGTLAPTSFVLPDLAPVADGSVATGDETPGGAVAAAAPTVVQLASGGVAPAPARDTRRIAARLLISASDTTPLFLVLVLALVSALGAALFLRRLGSRLR